MKNVNNMAKAKQAPDPASPAARLQMAAKRAKDEGDLSQAEKFAQAARDLGCDDDDDKFKGVLRKLAKPKTSSSERER